MANEEVPSGEIEVALRLVGNHIKQWNTRNYKSSSYLQAFQCSVLQGSRLQGCQISAAGALRLHETHPYLGDLRVPLAVRRDLTQPCADTVGQFAVVTPPTCFFHLDHRPQRVREPREVALCIRRPNGRCVKAQERGRQRCGHRWGDDGGTGERRVGG